MGGREHCLGGELKEPFFLGAGIFQPHLPNYALQEYFDRFPLDEIELPEGYLEEDLEDVPEASSKQRILRGPRRSEMPVSGSLPFRLTWRPLP